jgi:hypothetical protein
MPEPAPKESPLGPQRSRPQFGLSRLFLVILAAAIALACWRAMTQPNRPFVHVLYFMAAVTAPFALMILASMVASRTRRNRRR